MFQLFIRAIIDKRRLGREISEARGGLDMPGKCFDAWAAAKPAAAAA